MELRQLEIFRVLARELNFTRTAGLVNCVQSNVTAQIRSLERELGTPLFERLGRRVVLTDAGSQFLPYADRVLDLLAEAKDSIQGDAEPSGTLVIGAPETILIYRLPAVLQVFRQRYPRVKLTFRPTSRVELASNLAQGELDIAFFMEYGSLPAGVEGRTLYHEPILLVAQPGHPLLRKRRVTAADLAEQTLVLTERGCSYRVRLEQILQRARVAPLSILEFASIEAIKQCVRLGEGVGLLPGVVVEQDLARGAMVRLPWSGLDLTITAMLAWHKDKWMSPALEALKSVTCEVLGRNEEGAGGRAQIASNRVQAGGA